MPKLTEIFVVKEYDEHDPDSPTADPFDPESRAEIEADKPENVEDVAKVKQFSKAFGAIERGINEAKNIIEHVPGIDHEMTYEALDELADHAYEVWRHLIYGEEMVRWKRKH
jgi:hypothetical protein